MAARRRRPVTYLVLLRGINVGGKNRVPMAQLRRMLTELGFTDVSTYIASGNVILRSDRAPADVKARIEAALPRTFELDADHVEVVVLDRRQLEAIVEDRPEGFGERPDLYHSDAIFLSGIDATEAMAVFDAREGVDRVWPGDGVIYSQRVSALRTKSRLSRIAGTAAYASMTIRSWTTTTALLELMRKADAGDLTPPR